jgi:hypothetical protein
MTTPIVANGAPVRNQLLYILRSSAKNLIKVGVSYDPEQRLRQLVTGHPFELEVAYVVEFEENLAESVEKITKAILDYRKTKERGEWFDISVDGAIDAIKQARVVHEFCRKRIPPTIVEVTVEKIVDRPVFYDKEYVGYERALSVFIWAYRKIFETFFGVKCVIIFWAIITAVVATSAIIDINNYGFSEFMSLAYSTPYANEFTLEFASLLAVLPYAAVVVSVIIIDRRKRTSLLLR